jgi:hypothetical protein
VAQPGVQAGKSLKEVYEMARRRMDPTCGKYPIYEHCMPFDVSATRDREMWKSIA